MIELFVIALLGSAVAGIWDLRTTEVPDEIPVSMTAFGLFYWFIASLRQESIMPLAFSFLSGMAILVPGLLLYRLGKWGAADAWVPASTLFIYPLHNGELVLAAYFVNFLFVSSAFMVAYSLLLGLMNRRVFPLFIKDVLKNRWVYIIIGSYLALMAVAYIFGSGLLPLGYSFLTVLGVVLFWRYAVIIENSVFRKTISTKDLKEGDVLEGMIWVGLTKEQVAEIKKRKKTVVIKEGVRFVPVFPITLLVTFFHGNVIFYLFL